MNKDSWYEGLSPSDREQSSRWTPISSGEKKQKEETTSPSEKTDETKIKLKPGQRIEIPIENLLQKNRDIFPPGLQEIVIEVESPETRSPEQVSADQTREKIFGSHVVRLKINEICKYGQHDQIIKKGVVIVKVQPRDLERVDEQDKYERNSRLLGKEGKFQVFFEMEGYRGHATRTVLATSDELNSILAEINKITNLAQIASEIIYPDNKAKA